MTFIPGDIVEFDSPVAGHTKYHVCVLEIVAANAAVFLFINSKSGYAGDLVCKDSDIPCLPPSPTGKSVISCSQLVRANAHQLRVFRARKLGSLPASVARRLEAFAKTVPTLTREERRIVLAGLARVR